MQIEARVPSDAITAVIPVYRFGLIVGDMYVHVRANWDEALGGLTADIWAEDANEDRHALPQSLVPSILAEIKEADPNAYREIIEASGKLDKAA